MVDDRLPGDPPLRDKQYRCPVPGCDEKAPSAGKPVCPRHKLPMELSSGTGR